MVRKESREFTPADFVEDLVWIPSDNLDNEDEVVTCQECDHIGLEGTFFLAARFRLADGSCFAGYVRIGEAKVTLIALAISEGQFAFLLLVDELRELLGETYDSFADQLGKQINQVFPLHYQTNHSLADGSTVEGDIEH